MPTRPNGGFIGSENVTDHSTASGIYTLNEARILTEAGDFPSGGYIPSRSLRFRRSGNTYLYRTPSPAGNRKTWTMSVWMKFSNISNEQGILGAGYSDGSEDTIYYSSNRLRIRFATGSDNTPDVMLRDPSAWYHIILAVDTTQADQKNRLKWYLNGKEIGVLINGYISDHNAFPDLDHEFRINNAQDQLIGRFPRTGDNFDGYMSDFNFIDGQQLTPDSFGAFDAKTGMWVPKRYTGSYGTQGYFLSFANATSTTTLGYDDGTGAIGAGAGSNDFTTTGFSVSTGVNYDSMVDVPGIGSAVSVDTGGVVRGNYCTWNTLQAVAVNAGAGVGAFNITDGGLKSTEANSSNTCGYVIGTMAVSSGKWYWEVDCTSIGGSYGEIGIHKTSAPIIYGGTADADYRYRNDGTKYNGSTGSSYGTSLSTGNTVGVALDLDVGTITFYRNGVSQGVAFTGLSGEFSPSVGDIQNSTANTYTANFGQKGFTYNPPAGHKSLCAPNIPDPEIIRSKDHFDVKLYTGNGTAQAIGNTAKELDNYEISNSLRFNDGDSNCLQRTPTYKTNGKRWTYSTWVKRANISIGDLPLISAKSSTSTNRLFFWWASDDLIYFYFDVGGSTYQVNTTTPFKSSSDWYHIVLACDSTQVTDRERFKVYVDGIQLRLSGTFIPQNTFTQWNNTSAHLIGRKDTSDVYFDGYQTNIHNIDGAQLTPDSFGQFDVDGSWQPKEYSPTTPMNMPRTDYVAYFDGDGDYINFGNSSDFAFGSGDFTIECWVWPNNLPARHQMIMHKGHPTNNNQFDWRIYFADTTVSSYQLWFECYIGGTQYGLPTNSTSTQHFIMNAWNHVVITRKGSVLTGYLNGQIVGTASITTGAIDTNYTNTYFGVGNVGAAGQTYFDGYAADLRVIKGTAYWDGIPNSELTAVSNTKLLTFQDSTFVDNSGTSKTLTASGNAAMIRHGADYGINGFHLPMNQTSASAVPTWNYNPMATMNTATGSFVNDTTYIYLTGAGYDGGYKGSTVSVSSFKALKNSWNMDYVANRNGVNSSPFPNYVIGLGRASTASSYSSGPTQSIWNMYISNNYNFNIYVQNGNGTTLGSFNQGSSSWAYAGVAFRVSFNASTYTYTFYGNTSGLFTGMTQIYTYTLTAPQISAIQTYVDSNFYILGTYRANDDGWRNIRWYTV